MSYEYKIVPAPNRGLKAKGVKAPQDRFALALQTVLNETAADGWEYQRADTLPCEERVGFTGRTTNYQNMLVFRRLIAAPEVKEPVIAVPAVEAPKIVADASTEEPTVENKDDAS